MGIGVLELDKGFGSMHMVNLLGFLTHGEAQ